MKEWLPAIVLVLQLAVALFAWWRERNSKKAAVVEALKKEAKDAQTPTDITRFFDHVR